MLRCQRQLHKISVVSAQDFLRYPHVWLRLSEQTVAFIGGAIS